MKIEDFSEVTSIERVNHHWVEVIDKDGGQTRSQSTEANLMFEILKELKRIGDILEEKNGKI